MWGLLPLLLFIVLWVGCFGRGLGGRQSFIYAALLWGLAVFGMTEATSLFQSLSFFSLLITWGIAFLIACIWSRSSWRLLKPAEWFSKISSLSLTEKFLILSIMTIAAVKIYSAIMSAPNTSDSFTYHLSRIEHWIQNATVAYYPTNVLRQLYTPVFSEYVILNFRILSQADYLSNAVQWFACIGSWVAVSLLAKRLGTDRCGQLLAVLLAASLPMGLVQATSTQTDYVMTFWFVSFVVLLWNLWDNQRYQTAAVTGACLGLAFLTKGNAYVYSLVFLMIYIIASMSLKIKAGHRIKLIFVTLIVALILNIPYALRNTSAFGSPYWTHNSMVNKNISLPIAGLQILRNASLHMGTPWKDLNEKIQKQLEGACRLLGYDVKKPSIALHGDRNIVVHSSTGEDDTGNTLYLMLYVFVILAVLFNKSLRRKEVLLFAGALIVMAVIFCNVVNYYIYNSRYHLAMFVISCALSGAVFRIILRRQTWVIAVLVLFCSWPWLLACNEHPFLGKKSILKTSRMEQYFSQQPSLLIPYNIVAQIIQSQDCRNIGLIDSENTWEYPWWGLFQKSYGKNFRIEHVEVSNESAKLSYPKGDFIPCALIAHNDARQYTTLEQSRYLRVWFMDLPGNMTSVFLKVPDHL